MKTAVKVLVTVTAICLAFAFAFVTVYSMTWENAKISNLNISYNKITKECIASDFEWDGNTENMTFTVPDEYEGMKIKSLGGAVGLGAPTHFCVMVPQELHKEVVSGTATEDCIGIVDENTVTYSFTVNLGENIKNFENFSYQEYFMDKNDKVIYIVEIKYECSESNKWAYSEDGKLYDKNTNKLL